jgi:hypothetical protein
VSFQFKSLVFLLGLKGCEREKWGERDTYEEIREEREKKCYNERE